MESIFVLGGGYEWKNEDQMNRLAQLILSKFSSPKILDVWFAQTEGSYEKYDDVFVDIYKSNSILFERKIATKENLINECQWANVINIHGGSTKLLSSVMKNYDLDILYKDKIVIGSSAGAIFLSSYNPNWNGKGNSKNSEILPLNVIVHYGDDKQLEEKARWNDLVVSMTESPIGFSVVLKENDIRAFDKSGKEVII